MIITIGAALIGMVAGEMLVTDPALADWMSGDSASSSTTASRRSAR